MKIEELDLSAIAWVCLFRAGFTTVDEVKKLSYKELLKIRNLGSKYATEIVEKLEHCKENNNQ